MVYHGIHSAMMHLPVDDAAVSFVLANDCIAECPHPRLRRSSDRCIVNLFFWYPVIPTYLLTYSVYILLLNRKEITGKSRH
ncbi:hypothetical protein BDV36DRAFT_278132 [Aspergillus pseudocaelatus]|uniref:Uncharacterized protein n=1 Tax=Aspergillus pseudocaelatus TaxID=1825620 RepID=A0ABQ6W4N9_9EURO|nr:hypothetical protein BDV36DRAFT_278132 [Aspergillus pseudocaelatus]